MTSVSLPPKRHALLQDTLNDTPLIIASVYRSKHLTPKTTNISTYHLPRLPSTRAKKATRLSSPLGYCTLVQLKSRSPGGEGTYLNDEKNKAQAQAQPTSPYQRTITTNFGINEHYQSIICGYICIRTSSKACVSAAGPP